MPTLRGCTLLVLFALVLAPLSIAQNSVPYAIHTVAGSGSLGDGGPATAALLEFPQSVVVDPAGNLYIGDYGDGLIRKVNTSGVIHSLAAGVAVSMKMDSFGNIYFTDGVSRVYKMVPNGDIYIVAGSGLGYGGDGGPATSAMLFGPNGVAVDAQGNIYVADTYNLRVREITADGKIQTIAGNGTAAFGKDGISATASPLAYPYGVEVDSAGNIYISEEFRIRKVNSTGVITTLAGNGVSPVDGLAINSAIGWQVALAEDKLSNLYLADSAYNMVRMISPAGRISTLAGSETAGFVGDGTYTSQLNAPSGVSVDAQGNVYIADQVNQRIRMLSNTGKISTVAGSTHYLGDGGPATAALMLRPEEAVLDSAGNLIISDTYNNVIRKVDTQGNISTIVGSGLCSYSGDNGKAALATVCLPKALAFDSAGNLFIADWGNNVVRRLGTDGKITTIAGNGQYGDSNVTSANATGIPFEGPYGLAFDSKGDLYISDNVTNRVHVVTGAAIHTVPLPQPGGTIVLFAGTGSSGDSGDGGLSTAAQLNSPTHVAVGSDGTVYIVDSGNNRVRKVVPPTAATPGIIAPASIPQVKGITLSGPDGILVDSSSSLYVTWSDSNVVTKTTTSGVTSIIAGSGASGLSGDGGLATSAEFAGPAGITTDAAGDLFVTDLFNNRVRKLIPDNLTGMLIAAGDGQSGNVGTTLPGPLVVTLTFQGGAGIAGIPVTFAVTSGSATLSLQTSVTDSNGNAGVAVTLGSTPGPVVITASASGVASVQFHLTAVSTVPLPTITSGGIIGAGGSTPAITALSSGGFATVFGTNFAPAGTFLQPQSTTWPTVLGGVCVMVNGVPAYVTFVSPTQVNFQVPNVPANATVNVQVISNCGTSSELDSAIVPVATLTATPEFLYWVKNANGQNPVVAVDSFTNAYIGASGLIAGATFTPAKPGEVVTVYGVSFGPTNPAAVPGTPPAAAAQSIYPATVRLGSLTLDPSAVYYAGVSPGTAGLYQLNIQVPTTIADGDYPIVLTLGAFTTPTGGFLTVKN